MGGGCARGDAFAAGAGHLVPALGAAAGGRGGRCARQDELAFWSGMLGEPSLPLIDGALDPARDVSGSARQLTLTLPASVTGALLTRVPAAFHGGINEVLLTGLVLALADWRRRRGAAAARRTSGADRSRGPRPRGAVRGRRPVAHGGLVHQPVPGAARSGRARSRRGAGGRGGARPRAQAIKEQLRALPDHGLGYGLLRYLNPQTAAQLEGFASPQIGFNYLGRFAAPAARRLGGGGGGR